MQSTIRDDMVKTKNASIFDRNRFGLIPSFDSFDFLAINSKRLSLVLEQPSIIFIFVWVESDLLLLASSRIHGVVRVQISAMSVVMSDTNPATHDNVNRDVLHSFGIEGSLEFRRHEAVTIAWIDEADEVYAKQGNIESEWDHDQTEESGKKVLEPQTLSTTVSNFPQCSVAKKE